MFAILMSTPAFSLSPVWILAAPILLLALFLNEADRKRVIWGVSAALLLILPTIVMRCPDWWIFCW